MDWVFQVNPNRYDLDKAMSASLDDSWTTTQHRGDVQVGDTIYFWRSGPNAGLVAIARITSPVFYRGEESKFGPYGAKIRYEARLQPYISKVEVLAEPDLSSVRVFRGLQGTNFPIRDPAIAKALRRIVAGRQLPLPDAGGSSVYAAAEEQAGKDLGEAAKRYNEVAVAKLREYVSTMDSRAFEFLVAVVMLKLGYLNVQVTPASGDQGIDVKATFSAGDVMPMRFRVQAKRSIGAVHAPVIATLRGSLRSGEVGLLATSGLFSPGARKEAKADGKVPIGLIDGTQLIELMVKHGVGMKQESIQICDVDLKALSLEALSDVVDEAEVSES